MAESSDSDSDADADAESDAAAAAASDSGPRATPIPLVVTGTPGTGKTSATETLAVERDLRVLHLNEVVREAGLYTDRDEERDSLIADMDAVAAYVAERPEVDVVESHLAHHLPAQRVAVLRCRPDVLEKRLTERGESAASARENRESEALDVVLGEAVERHGTDRVYELDTTERDPDEVAAELGAVLDGEREPAAGTVEFTEYL